MKPRSLTSILTAALVAVGATIAFEQPSQAQTRFECMPPRISPNQTQWPTTYAFTAEGLKPVIRWNSQAFSQAGYTPMERCRQVTERFNTLYERPEGIGIITTGYLNGLPVVYSPVHGGERANRDNLLFTLKKNEDAALTVQKLFDVRAGAAGALFESSADGDSITIDFKKFLENTPVETNTAPSAAPGIPQKPMQQPSGRSSW